MTKNVVQALLAAIPAIEAENNRLDEEYGTQNKVGIDLFNDRKQIERTFAKNAHEDRLEQRLMAFDDESLLKAETLMYYGRDRERCTFREKLNYLRSRRDSRHEIVRTIMEKIPACGEYLVVGQSKLRREGLSVDMI